MKSIFLIILLLPFIISIDKDSGVEINTDQYKQSVDTSIIQGKVFYLLRNDLRECLQPRCGGFFLTPLNNDQGLDDVYVSEALVDDGLDYKLIQGVYCDQTTESPIVVTGTIKNSHNFPGYKCIQISDIYKAMDLPNDYNPNVSQDQNGGIHVNSNMVRARPSFFMMKVSPFICNRIGKCPPISTLRLNTDDIQFVQSYDEPYTSNIGLLDTTWFTSRLVSNDNNNAIVKGVQYGDKLVITRVFVNSLDPKEQCPKSFGNCDHSLGLIPVFTRDKDRCSKFDTCVAQGPCHLMVPHCPDGYQLASIIFGNKACNKYYCDPDFLPITQKRFNK